MEIPDCLGDFIGWNTITWLTRKISHLGQSQDLGLIQVFTV